MFLRPDFFSRTLPLAGLVCLMAGCVAVTPPPTVVAPPPPVTPPSPPPPPPPPPPPVPQVDPADAAARRFFSYHDQLRQMSAAELAQEVVRANASIMANPSAASPSLVLELALALAQARGTGDLSRALAVLDPLVRSSSPELLPWQPQARLLQARLIEQRRLEEQLERQAGQLRDAQRSLQQTTEKLEALKAIERSLNARPASSGPASMPAATPKAP